VPTDARFYTPFARDNGNPRVLTTKSTAKLHVREGERKGARTEAISVLFLRETMVIGEPTTRSNGKKIAS
jgi:hypothetical protein